MAKLVSKTYGDALFAIAMEENKIDDFSSEVEVLETVIDENPNFSKLMENPKIEKSEKINLLESIFKAKVSDEVLSLMEQLVTKGHYGQMLSVFTYFIAQVKEYKNIGIVNVSSALPLSNAQKSLV